MNYRYIFNTSGNYVGYIYGNNLFYPNGEWVGFILNGNELYSAVDGAFVGYVSSDDRIVRQRYEPPRLQILRPLPPLNPIRPLPPLRRLRMFKLQYPWIDVFDPS